MSLMGDPRPFGTEFELWMKEAYPSLLEKALGSHLSTERGVVTMMEDAFYQGKRRASAVAESGKNTPA